MTSAQPHTFGAIEDTSLPLAVLVHGFPDTPFTWRHLGPDLVARGYRVVAPWLPGYDAPTDRPISVGTGRTRSSTASGISCTWRSRSWSQRKSVPG